jgi:putative ABC transport system permease protein
MRHLLRLAWANARHDRLVHALHVLVLASGVALTVSVLLIGEQLSDRLRADAEGIDLVIGAIGSPLQLVLSTVYHLDVPIGNIDPERVNAWARHSQVEQAIPIAIGDEVDGHRIVGTVPAYLEHYGARMVAGRMWARPMEAVLGERAARALDLSLGDRFDTFHSFGYRAADHRHAPFVVVGILAPSQTVLDRLVLTSLDSIWDAHEGITNPAGVAGHDEAITALLVRYRTPLAAAMLPRQIHAQGQVQAASPAVELARLLSALGVGFDAARWFAGVLLVVAGAGIFFALFGALEARRVDIAVMRSLGASRGDVALLLWMEATLLSLAGALAGLLLGHTAVELIGRLGPRADGLGLTGWRLIPADILLPLAVLALATLASALPLWRVYRSDIARTLAEA